MSASPYRRFADSLDRIDAVLREADPAPFDILAARIAARPRVFVTGSGRSGLAARAFAMRLAHLGIETHVAGETTTPPIGRGDVLVAVTGSGDTPSVVAHARKAKEVGASVAAVTARPDSPMAELAEIVAELNTPSKGGGDPEWGMIGYGGTLFERTAFLYLEALWEEVAERLGLGPEDLASRHANLE